MGDQPPLHRALAGQPHASGRIQALRALRGRASLCTVWYMNYEHSELIDAEPAAVWALYADVERWPEWTTSVTRVTGLEGADLRVGKRFRIEQPRLPSLVWDVTAVEPGASWTWMQRSFGSTTVATHEVIPTEGQRTTVRQRIEQRGPIGVVVGLLMGRLTKRYLAIEAAGLKRRCEDTRNGAAAR